MVLLRRALEPWLAGRSAKELLDLLDPVLKCSDRLITKSNGASSEPRVEPEAFSGSRAVRAGVALLQPLSFDRLSLWFGRDELGKDPQDLIVVGVTSLCILAIVGLVIGIKAWLESRPYHPRKKKSGPGIFRRTICALFRPLGIFFEFIGTYLAAAKENYCPSIEWNQGDET